jgi:predicted acyl esterase
MSASAAPTTDARRRPRRKLLLALLVTATLGLIPITTPPAGAIGGGVVDISDAAPASFTVTPGVELLTVTGAAPLAPLTLVDAATLERLVTVYTDTLGQLVIPFVPRHYLVFDPRDGILPTTDGSSLRPGQYRIVSEGIPGQPFAGPKQASDPFTVLGVDDVPDTALYAGQVLPFVPTTLSGGVAAGHTDEEGYGYLQVRDGVKLSVNVRLPDPNQYGPGPYPTVVQYSGYAPSKPGTPSGADAGGVLATALGFAYVGVNVRGSGCSGGTFDVFNAAQAADGYDVIETVARQPWVKDHRPAMMGISYSGITQLYVAATNPPSLAAITPVSVIEDPWYQQWPGGIYNAGFTKNWLASRDSEAIGGSGWVKDRVAGGDTTCATNRLIRSQSIPFEAFARSLERRPLDADARRISLLAPKIHVPVYLTGAWQDEQTGAQFATMLDDFVNVPAGQKKFTMFNGVHNDGFSPLMFTRWFEFLAFYVDKSIPKVNNLVRFGAPNIFKDMFGYAGLGFESNRFLLPFSDTPRYGTYAASRAVYEAEPEVRVLFEVGASPDFPNDPRAPRQRFDMYFASWPPPAATLERLYFGADGTLSSSPATVTGTDRFSHDAAVLGTAYSESNLLGPPGANSWKPTADGKGLAYETAPLAENMVVAGPGHVDLWFRSTGSDAPLEVVLSEVYADPDPTDGIPPGEVRVQHGLLRAGYPRLDPARSRGAQVDHLFYAPDYQPLAPGEWRNIQIPLYAVAHPFRAGSRLRVEVNTAGGDAPAWSFESPNYGATTHDVGWGGLRPSSLVLSVLPDQAPYSIPAAFAGQDKHPTCDWLRAQPCRSYHALANQTVAVEEPTTTTTTTATTTTTEPPSSSTTTTPPTTPPPSDPLPEDPVSTPPEAPPSPMTQAVVATPSFTG